jgi:hypothetical protein
MRPPGETPMKVLMIKRLLAARSRASKPYLSIRELAGARFASVPVMPGGTGRRSRRQNCFSFTYFHSPSAAHPLGWPLQMTNGKARRLPLQRYLTRRRLHTPFSVRQKGAVVALLPPSYQLEDVLKRPGFEGQDHLQQGPQLGDRNGRCFFSPSVSVNARGRSALTSW